MTLMKAHTRIMDRLFLEIQQITSQIAEMRGHSVSRKKAIKKLKKKRKIKKLVRREVKSMVPKEMK